ncbi:hypothetical protein [Xylanimonas ulmi]|uniref:Uncharacterized protein n=1 Tax=Xylanimonas ulmi TaxID=228973 RepID=A0A4Q7LZD4_9MICO|nr:hypothetical protein [Xylanibacterium ulmi]RZS60765.1 hypothetical protein EV386_1045 [Xylanibacterium ulmi]
MGIRDERSAMLVGGVRREAEAAWDAGHDLHAPVLPYPPSGRAIPGGGGDVAAMAEAVLAVGWRLHTWTVVADGRGRMKAAPLFVRPGVEAR